MPKSTNDQIWIDAGKPDCDGAPVWTRVKETPNGLLGPWTHWTCPNCSLSWYNRTS